MELEVLGLGQQGGRGDKDQEESLHVLCFGECPAGNEGGPELRRKSGVNDISYYQSMSSNSLDLQVFDRLFRDGCLKCFGHPVDEPLTETESRLLYNRILEETGLVVGWKSLKNYSLFVMGASGRQENPSVASLDTLSRYVLGAPYETEAERRKSAEPYAWWYKYRRDWKPIPGVEVERPRRRVWVGRVGLLMGLAFLIVAAIFFFHRADVREIFTEEFHSPAEDSLTARGWWVASKDEGWWAKRGEYPGSLTLYTLKGDNWPDPVEAPVIRNLLWRSLSCDCCTLELRLKDFIPRQNWQQAGIILSEDTGFRGRSIRVSIAYNDFGGGYKIPGAVILQAITSSGGRAGKPEEIAHYSLVNMDTLTRRPLLAKNLDHSAIRIEKRGSNWRLLYADGILENTSFKEVVSHDFVMKPRYVGLFALKGFVDSAAVIPARFSFFSVRSESCR